VTIKKPRSNQRCEVCGADPGIEHREGCPWLRVTELEAALREYADARHWGLQRFDLQHPAAVWIGPGADDLPIPDAPALARDALTGDGGGERVTQLEAALRDLFEGIGDPEDVDQDCRFCTGHYFRHDDDCVWATARRALAGDDAA
jgi:hypothetical protein